LSTSIQDLENHLHQDSCNPDLRFRLGYQYLQLVLGSGFKWGNEGWRQFTVQDWTALQLARQHLVSGYGMVPSFHLLFLRMHADLYLGSYKAVEDLAKREMSIRSDGELEGACLMAMFASLYGGASTRGLLAFAKKIPHIHSQAIERIENMNDQEKSFHTEMALKTLRVGTPCYMQGYSDEELVQACMSLLFYRIRESEAEAYLAQACDWSVQWCLQTAQRLHSDGFTRLAFYLYATVLALEASNAEAALGYGKALLDMGAHELALGHFLAVMDKGINEPFVYEVAALAAVLTRDQLRLSAILTRARKAGYDSVLLGLYSGYYFEQAGKPDRAAHTYRGLLEQQPDFAIAQNGLRRTAA
jgi:hypothetical protein